MAGKDEITKLVYNEFDILFGWRPQQGANVPIEHDEEDYVEAFLTNVVDNLGLDADPDEAPREINALIAWLAQQG